MEPKLPSTGRTQHRLRIMAATPSRNATRRRRHQRKSPCYTYNIKERELVSLFNKPYSPDDIAPKSDFYSWINYRWIAHTTAQLKHRQNYYVQVDSFRVAQENTYIELLDIVKTYIRTNPQSKKATAIKHVHNAMAHLNETDAEHHVAQAVDRIDEIIHKNNIYEMLAEFNKNELVSWGAPVVWSMSPDEKNAKTYRHSITMPQLTIYDYEIYIDDSKAYQKTFRRKYFQFLQDMFKLCCPHDTSLDAQDVWDVELELLNAMGCVIPNIKESKDFYNVVQSRNALRDCGFDWTEFASVMGFPAADFFICSSLNAIQCIMRLLVSTDNAEQLPNWQTKKWRTYFIYLHVRQIMRFHKKWRLVFYEFHGRFVHGQPIPFPDELYPVFALSICFNSFLTNEYVRNNPRKREIDYVQTMSAKLLDVFKCIIRKNTWLSAQTKRFALMKLEHIHVVIGSPDIMRYDPILNYSNTDAYGNMKLIMNWRFNKFRELDGHAIMDIPSVDWDNFKLTGTQAYVVNAYYTPTENKIYIPLAYLQKPFIDLDERGIEYNLSFIGYTLAHEMSHCLDDMGSKYDHRGNLHNWWTTEDRRKFNVKVRDVIAQYKQFMAYDKIFIEDGHNYVGESLADISGIHICSEFLREFQEKNNDIIPIRDISFRAFFTYIAVQGRQKIYDSAIQAQLKTNPHPMDKYRVNCSLARLRIFKNMYNITPKDKMWWKNSDTIW